MYEKGPRKGTLRFTVQPATQAAKVHVAGDFNGWKPLAMRKLKMGAYAANVPAKPGKHEYKFLVDGQWIADPDNPSKVANAFGTENSVAKVK